MPKNEKKSIESFEKICEKFVKRFTQDNCFMNILESTCISAVFQIVLYVMFLIKTKKVMSKKS